MPIILPRHGLEQGPCLCFKISRKIQDRVKGGEGEAGKGAGLRNRVGWQESRHREVFSRSNLWAKNRSEYISKEKFIEKSRRNNGLRQKTRGSHGG